MPAAKPEARRARALIYHTLAEALSPPEPGLSELLLEAATAGAQALGSSACRWTALDLAKLPRPDMADLRARYARLIGGPGQRPVALYESLHLHGQLAGPVTWSVERHYRALGLAPIQGELPDHASLELAFLGHLAAAEAEAGTAGDGGLAARLEAERRAFIRMHAGLWLPRLGAALAGTDDPLYSAVGHLLRGFVSEELDSRTQARPAAKGHPVLNDPAACTLCGLCTRVCALGALQVCESTTETALTMDALQCTGCNRCVRICPDDLLVLAPDTLGTPQNGSARRVIRRSGRAACPECGRPTVSQAEMDAVCARLQPDPITQARLRLCVECKTRFT